MRKRILVTGARGFIGRALVQTLKNEVSEVVGIGRQDCDLLDFDMTKSMVKNLAPDCIFHLAASSSNESVGSWMTVSDNYSMLANIARSMPGHCKLIYTGSMAELGASGVHDEAALCVPQTHYGFSKNCATNLAVWLNKHQGLDITVARLFGVYGPGEGPQRLFPFVVKRLLSSEIVPLSDGTQVRDFVHISDVCDVLCALMRSNENIQIVNVSTGLGVAVKDVVLLVAQHMKADKQLLKFGMKPRRNLDEDTLVGDIKKLSTIVQVPIQHWTAGTGLSLQYVDSLIEQMR